MVLVDPQLVRAIDEKRLIQLTYKGGSRIAEPHDYGVQKGIARLLIYQVRGYSRSRKPSGWRLLDVEGIQHLELLDERFPGSRVDGDEHHQQWDQLFARVG